MYQLDWYDGTCQKCEIDISSIHPFDLSKIELIQDTFWAEHCIECAPPECYKSCEYYQERFDGRCKRTTHGQELVAIDRSIYGYGVLFTFRPWAKIESYVFDHKLTPEESKIKFGKYLSLVKSIKKFGVINVKYFFNNVGYYFRTRSKWRSQTKIEGIDSVIFEAYSFEDAAYKMIFESADINLKVLGRTSVTINPGFNSYVIDYQQFAPEGANVLRFYPENNIEATILVVNAAVVKLKKLTDVVPAKKVKCLAWDLDNTLWDGILSETENARDLALREGVRSLITDLDKRGVIQTIVSKNDYEPAWAKICSLGLDDYFLYPAINWGRKSENLRAIAKKLNIGIDTFAMIDDSEFERGEISESIPQMRVYNEKIIKELLSLPEFDIPVTEEASNRRSMYQTEEKRKQIFASYGGNYMDFLKSCEIKLEIGYISESTDQSIVNRCFELVSRTNQLNISGHKYTREDFEKHLKADGLLHVYFKCMDKYGQYGIVGYMSFTLIEKNIDIDEFAVSCRVAQKHVEYTVLSWQARSYSSQRRIRIKYIRTEKNGPMLKVLKDSGCIDNGGVLLINCKDISMDDGIITIAEI